MFGTDCTERIHCCFNFNVFPESVQRKPPPPRRTPGYATELLNTSTTDSRRLYCVSLCDFVNKERLVLCMDQSACQSFSPAPSNNISVDEWFACWAWVHIAVATLSGNSLRQAVHTHCASVHQAAKLVAALLRAARVTAGLAESNGSLPPGL